MKLVKFGAEWCGPCRTLDAKLEKFTGCEVVKYDISDDENEDLIEKYKIRNIPVTFLMTDNDEIVKKWVGDFDLNEITALLNQ